MMDWQKIFVEFLTLLSSSELLEKVNLEFMMVTVISGFGSVSYVSSDHISHVVNKKNISWEIKGL